MASSQARHLRRLPLLLLLLHHLLVLLCTLSYALQATDSGASSEEPLLISTTTTTTASSFDQMNPNSEQDQHTSTTTTSSTSTSQPPLASADSQASNSSLWGSTTPGQPDVQMELISAANVSDSEPTTLEPLESWSALENVTQQPQLVRNRKSSEQHSKSQQFNDTSTTLRRTDSSGKPQAEQQVASTVSTLDYDDFDLDYQIKLNSSESAGKRDYEPGAPVKPPTWSALIRQPHVFTSSQNQSVASAPVGAHQAPHIPPALLTVKSTQLSSQELDKIKSQLLMFQDQYESFGADQSLAFANGDLLATASHGTVSPASILALNGSGLDGAMNVTHLRKLAMDLQSSGMPSIAPLMLENLLMQAKLLPNRSNLFSTLDEGSSTMNGPAVETMTQSSSETTPLSMGSGSSSTTPASVTTTPANKGLSQVNQWHNYPHPNIHQNPLLLHHILNKQAFYTQQVNQQQQQQQSNQESGRGNADIAIASTASTPIQLERPTPGPTQESTRDFSSHTPSTSSSTSSLFLENLQHLQAQQKRAILSSTFQQLARNSAQPAAPQPLTANQRPASWIGQQLWRAPDSPAKAPATSQSILALPSLLQEFYAPQPSLTSGLGSPELAAKQELLRLLRQRQLQLQQVLQNRSETMQTPVISEEDMSTYVAQLSQQNAPTPVPNQQQASPSNQGDAQVAALLRHLRTSNSGLNLTELEQAVQKLLDAQVAATSQEASKNEVSIDESSLPSKQQASNWHKRPTVHVAPPMDSAQFLRFLASNTASASNQSSIINTAPPSDAQNSGANQQAEKEYSQAAEQLLARKKQLAFIEALKMRLQQQVTQTDGSISTGNALDEILALGSGEQSNGTTGTSANQVGGNDGFDDQVSNRQLPKWLERQILQGGFVHQSARTVPTIGKTIRTTYISRPPLAAVPHAVAPLFFRPAASQLQLVRQPVIMPAPLHPQPLVRLGPQQALQLLLGNAQFSLQRLPPQLDQPQVVGKIVVSHDNSQTGSVGTNSQSNQSQSKLLAESFPLASAPAYLIKLPTLTGGTITASGSFAPPSMRFLTRGRPLVPLRILSAPSRIRLMPAAANPSPQVTSSVAPSTSSSLQPASSMLHTQHQFPPMHPLMNPMIQAHLLQHQHQQQQQLLQQQQQQQQQLLRPLLAMASIRQQVPHPLAYNPAPPLATSSVPSPPQIPAPPPLAALQPADPIVESNSLLNLPLSSPIGTAPSASPEFVHHHHHLNHNHHNQPLANSQPVRFQQHLYPSASQVSLLDNNQSFSVGPPTRPASESGGSQVVISDGGSGIGVGGGQQSMGATLSRLQQATASLVELTSLASLVDEMAGSELDPSPAVALVQALSSLQQQNAQANNQQQFPIDGGVPQITAPLTLKHLLNAHLTRDRELSKARDMNNLERLVAAANAVNSAKGAQARLKVKYIRVPVAVYESTGEPVLTGSRSILGQAQMADIAAASAAARDKQTISSGAPESATPTNTGSEQQSPGSLASPSSTDYLFDELSSDSSPHLALALQELAQRQPVDQSELLALTSSYRGAKENQVQTIDPLELYVSLSSAPKAKSVRAPNGAGRKKRARKGRKKEIELEAIMADETGADITEADASADADEDDRVTRKDLPILESLINSIFHGPQQSPLYGPMYSPMPLDSYGAPWYRHRPLRAEASTIAESYVPHPLRHHHHHHHPLTRHRFSLGEIVGALGAKKIITSLLSKSRRSRTSKRTISHGSRLALAGGQAALGPASGLAPPQNSSAPSRSNSALSSVGSLNQAQQQQQQQQAHSSSARPNPVFVWFPMASQGMEQQQAAAGGKKRANSKLLHKTPAHNSASVIHGAQRLASGSSSNSSSVRPPTAALSNTAATGSSSPVPVSAGVRLKSNNHKPTTSYHFKTLFQSAGPRANATATTSTGKVTNASLEALHRREEVTAIPLYHVVADHYSKLYSEPSTQLAKHPSATASVSGGGGGDQPSAPLVASMKATRV